MITRVNVSGVFVWARCASPEIRSLRISHQYFSVCILNSVAISVYNHLKEVLCNYFQGYFKSMEHHMVGIKMDTWLNEMGLLS
jgi:hypothetical protein